MKQTNPAQKAISIIALTLVGLGTCPLLHAQRPNPAYLSDLPTEDRVTSAIKGADPIDTAARQAGAFWQLRRVIYDLALRQGRNDQQVTDDEKFLIDRYYLSYYGPWLRVQRVMANDRAALSKLEGYMTNPQFLSEVLQKTTSPTFVGLYYKSMGAPAPLDGRVQARQNVSGTAPPAGSAQAGGGQAGGASSNQEQQATDALAQLFTGLIDTVNTAVGNANAGDAGGTTDAANAPAQPAAAPGTADYYRQQGNEYFNQKENLKAVEAYKKALALKPDAKTTATLYNSIGMSYSNLKQWPNALPAFQQSALMDSSQVNARYNLGITYVELKQPDNAAAAFRGVLRLQPNHAEASNRLGVVLANQGKQADAIAAFQNAIKAKPDFPEPHCNMGNSYLVLTQYDNALSAYREALRYQPDYADASNGMGLAYYNLKNYGEAATAFQLAVRGKPNDSKRHYWLGLTYRQLKQYDNAVAALQEATRLAPTDADIANQLGAAYSAAKTYPEAAAQYKEAIRLKPDFGVAHYNLAATYTNLQQYDNALAFAKESVRLVPTDPDTHNQMGVIYYRLKQHANAVLAFQNAIQLKPGNLAQVYKNLGDTYVAMSKKGDALQVYGMLQPLDKDLAQALNNSINKMVAPAAK